jgi:hypothetical protein
MPHYTEITGGLLCCQMQSPNLLGKHRPTGEQISGMQNSHSYPWDKPAYTPDRLTSNPQKKLNNKQGTEKEHAAEGAGCSEHTGEVGRSKELVYAWTFSKQRLQRQKGCQLAVDKPLPEIGQIAFYKAHLLSQWPTSKVKQFAKLKNSQQTIITCWQQRAGWWISDLAPEKVYEAKKQAPNKPTQENPNLKPGQLVGHIADLWNLSTSHTSLREKQTK